MAQLRPPAGVNEMYRQWAGLPGWLRMVMPDPMAMPTPGFIPVRGQVDTPLATALRLITRKLPPGVREALGQVPVKLLPPERATTGRAFFNPTLIEAPLIPIYTPAHEAGHLLAGHGVRSISGMVPRMSRFQVTLEDLINRKMNYFTRRRLAGMFGWEPGDISRETTADLVAAALTGQRRSVFDPYLLRELTSSPALWKD